MPTVEIEFPKRTIYFESYCDDDLGECDAFFELDNGTLKIITAWSNNDAMYRSEYMDPLFLCLGIEVADLPETHQAEAKSLTCDYFGIAPSESDDEDEDDE